MDLEGTGHRFLVEETEDLTSCGMGFLLRFSEAEQEDLISCGLDLSNFFLLRNTDLGVDDSVVSCISLSDRNE